MSAVNPLDAAITDMLFGNLGIFTAIVTQSREYPFGITMGFIIFECLKEKSKRGSDQSDSCNQLLIKGKFFKALKNSS